MNPVVRALAVTASAVVTVTCADQAVSSRGARYARIPLAPSFAVAPAGGPNISVDHVRGVLRSGTDSSVVDAKVFGDSAVLEFENVVVHGDSSAYQLKIQAFDSTDIVFESDMNLQVKPGDNAPAKPTLEYTAPDMVATRIKISDTTLMLDWAGADSLDRSCLSHAGKYPNVRGKQLSVTGTDTNNAAVNAVRVGWTSRDTTVFTVDGTGFVQSRCSGKSAYVVARTFLNRSDSILVTVKAPTFSLIMSPDSAKVPRGTTRQLTALVEDENRNPQPAAAVSWASSDATRATVNGTGLVSAISNGRVLITATSGGRTTVGVIQVVPPSANTVKVQPVVALDSLGVGQTRGYFAKALDAAGRVIPDATGFVWSTTNSAVVTVNATSGAATAVAVGLAKVKVALDGKQDSVSIEVLTSLPPGGIKGKLTNAATGAALPGVLLSGPAGGTTTSAADGSFTLTGLQNGDDITLSLTGFVPTTAYSVPVFSNKTIEVPSLPMSPTSGASGIISGKVVSALSGSVVSGVTVKAYAGVNAGPTPKRPSVTPNFTATSDANGIFTISGAAAGNYTLVFTATGYSDQFSGANSVGGTTNTTKDILLPPAAVGGGIYIVVTWGDCTSPNVPCDLDAHLTGPKVAPDTGRFQVFHTVNVYYSAPDTIAALDVDDSNSRGPEIIGLRPSAAVGTYHFYVHNFSGAATPTSKALADSASARVDVYQDGHLIGTFFPPSGVAGTLWNVFDYDGARLIPVGTITNPADPNVLALRAWDFPANIGSLALRVRPLTLPGAAQR